MHCTHCGWNNHTRENYYKLVGYPPGHRLHRGDQWVNMKPDFVAYHVKQKEDSTVLSPSQGQHPSKLTTQQYQQLLDYIQSQMGNQSLRNSPLEHVSHSRNHTVAHQVGNIFSSQAHHMKP